MQLHQTYGNRYVQCLMESMGVQAKLKIDPPNDIYEREADSVTDLVTRAVESQVQRQRPEEGELLQGKPVVQRQPEEEEEIQTEAALVQRQPLGEEEVQMQLAEDQPESVSNYLETRINDARGNGQPLADNIRQRMERAFNADFSDVQVHTDAEADELSRELGAQAFTIGKDIFLRADTFQPESQSGARLLAHELTHVVQQGAHASPSLGKLRIAQHGDVYEKEAHRVAEEIANTADSGTRRQAAVDRTLVSNYTVNGVVQRVDERGTEGAPACPTREEGEVEESQSSPFQLVMLRMAGDPMCREWLLYDFAVGSFDFLPAKVSDLGALLEPLLSRLREPFLLGGSLVRRYLTVRGYADCIGSPTINLALRLGRADQFHAEFPMPDKILSWYGAPLDSYVADNSSREGRARNRSVLIEETLRAADVTPPSPEEIEEERRRAAVELPDYVARAITVIRGKPDLSGEQKRRITGFLDMILRPGINDEYLTAANADQYYGRNLYHESPSVLASHLRVSILDAIRYSSDINAFALRMVDLDIAIFNGIRRATLLYNFHGEESRAAHNVGDWVREHQEDANSIYSLYID